MNEILNKIKGQYRILPLFAFELRCQDNETNYYTKKFLHDVQPKFLYDVILSNKWKK